MQVRQLTMKTPSLTSAGLAELVALDPQLVLVFAPVATFEQPTLVAELAAAFPGASRIGCSTAGEICNDGVTSGSTVITALHFRTPRLRVASAGVAAMADSRAAGEALGRQLARDDLHAVLVLAPGVSLNGSALIEGLASSVGNSVTLTGGLAADDGKFEKTWTLCNDVSSPRLVVGVGFYGDTIKVSHGSFGGWQPFGPARKVTRASGNVLHELDGMPALDIYRRYLGDYAAGLPATGLLFPFSMLGEDHNEVGLIRTILGIDEATSSLILAGEVIADGYLRLMHASSDALIDGAEMAAKAALAMQQTQGDGLALLVSCVGRKLVMGGRVDEEVEAVADVFGAGSTIAGFYSNGEISPHVGSTSCALHNQTMTITYLHEAG
jgi:hypothetical protein